MFGLLRVSSVGRVAADGGRAEKCAMPVTAIWLLPGTGLPCTQPATSTRATLVADMDRVASRHLLPSFEPHITLHSSADIDVETVSAQLQTLKGAGPLSVTFEGIGSGEYASGEVAWNQACVAVVDENPQLLSLQRRVLEVFGVAAAQTPTWAPPLCKPHLSLAYGSKPSVRNEFTTPPPLVATHLAAWSCEPCTLEGVPQWKELARVAL